MKTDAATDAQIRTSKPRQTLPITCLRSKRERSQDAREQAKREREARDLVEAELAKLREQLSKAKARAKPTADPTERVDLLSGLLSQEAVDKLDADQIAERMATLFSERERRQHNTTAQADLVIGQLTEALYRRHAELFGCAKRGSNNPTVSTFLENYAGKSASWCRRCYKAFLIVTADDWNASSWDGTGGIEGINKSAADPNRHKPKRVNKVQQKLDALTDVVRRKEWEDAERLVSDWDTSE